MSDTVLVGHGHDVIGMPAAIWKQHLNGSPEQHQSRFAFMTPDHQRVRYFVVEQLVRKGKPVSPSYIAQELRMSQDRASAILRELEEHLVFLVCDQTGFVTWAFPVTVDETPHHLIFSTGEQVYAA